MKKKKIKRNGSRKKNYSQLGREKGDHESRNQAIIKMTEAGSVAEKNSIVTDKKGKKSIDPEKFKTEMEQVKTPILGTDVNQNTRSAKRARLKAARARGQMPKRKWVTDPVTGKIKRDRKRTVMPGSHAEYLQKHS